MRSYGALALFTLALITECFGAHSDRSDRSDRSRQRSSPVRSVPVAADIKRDADFDCPEEFGYYPHPTDCTLYYVCVFGGALLESCTGGLMYSHELQTCDWPRNVGCDGASVIGGEELERLSEREQRPPPPPPPRRTPPPPPPRAQPNPVITSRGQPKFNREEYEKQQQLYADVDDLPPVEEIENDRQQRVYRGQPSTIGQVQKDRDGYGSQVVSSGRNLNSNIIPASLPQSGKLGSFSFGSQVDDRRTATVTPAPQSYSEDSNNVTDSHLDRRLDIETNEISLDDLTLKSIRKKREVVETTPTGNETIKNPTTEISKRSDGDEEMEYVEVDPESLQSDDFERGKRQVRYYLKNGFKNPGKNWAIANPVKLVDLQQAVYNPNIQNFRYQPNFSGVGNNNYYNDGRQQFSYDNNLFTTANPFLSYQGQNAQSERPFKPSLPDPGSQKFYHNSANSATHIITKSPPISSLKNNGNPFSSLNGGFYNNSPRPITNQNSFSPQGTVNRPNNQASYQDSSLLPSTIVTGKPVQMAPPPRPQNSKQNEKQPVDDDYDEDSEESDSSSEEDEDDRFRHDFPKPPYEFTHPNHKYADIENPFANPNFDFDAFLSKISNGQYQQNPKIVQNIQRPHPTQNMQISSVKASAEVTTSSNRVAPLRSSTLDYKGMSTPTPFTYSHNPSSTLKPDENNLRSQKLNQQYHQFSTPQPSQQTFPQQQRQQQSFNKNVFSKGPQQTAGIPLEAVRPKLNPPNFRDDRQLPITYSFSTQKPYYEQSKIKGENPQIFSVSSKPYVVVAGTSQPILLSTPKQQYNVKPEKIISLPPHLVSTGKPYILSSVKPQNSFIAFKQSTPKPLTTIVNEQLSALQHYWSNPSTQNPYSVQSVTMHPSSSPDTNKLQNLFAPANKPSNQAPIKSQNMFVNIVRDPITTTTAPSKRRPIPKPSPEMNDYYYDDDDEQYYYEPAVKPKYMPSTEVKPQRPAMAQNYKEYDNYEDLDEGNDKPTTPRKPVKYTSLKPETVTKNHNDVSIVTKSPPKDDKNGNRKIPVPVLVDYSKPTNVLIRPEVSNYQIIHHPHRNRTIPNMRKPVQPESSPYTNRPPKYLNQTTLRPYTVRHRLAKSTPVPVKQVSIQNNKPTTERVRHPNIVAQMKLTTLRDSYNQETRFTKTKHDDKTNSLEPTESVAPISYSASPRPKMLYNGSQNYNPDQYDPYYAVYDEDGELYKDTDYVQQYNIASVRPVVQQTYRGTPPPARRPVETYTPRPVTSDDYDDALIQGQISNQNQYQSPVRHSTRGEGNELGYDHNPSSVRTTLYEATTISTTPRTTSTSTTTTTTQRSTTAPYTEAMTPSRYTPRSSTDENPTSKPESSSDPSEIYPVSSDPSTTPSTVNLSSFAKPFEKTDNSHRLQETLSTTEKILTSRRSSYVTNNNNTLPVETNRTVTTRGKKKVLSLTTGFSIRRNPTNANNPYTLTVHNRPLDENNMFIKTDSVLDIQTDLLSKVYFLSNGEDKKKKPTRLNIDLDRSTERSSPRKLSTKTESKLDQIFDRGLQREIEPLVVIDKTTEKTPYRTSSTTVKTIVDKTNDRVKQRKQSYTTETAQVKTTERIIFSKFSISSESGVYRTTEKALLKKISKTPDILAKTTDITLLNKYSGTPSTLDRSTEKTPQNKPATPDILDRTTEREILSKFSISSERGFENFTPRSFQRKLSVRPVLLLDKTTEKSNQRKVFNSRRNYARTDLTEDNDIPIRPRSRSRPTTTRTINITPKVTSTTTFNTNYIRRPNNEEYIDSTENSINSEYSSENPQSSTLLNSYSSGSKESSKWNEYASSQDSLNEPAISPYRTLDSLRSSYRQDETVKTSTLSTTSTTRFTTSVTPKKIVNENLDDDNLSRKSSYYSYRVDDDSTPDQTTEVFSGKVKHVIQAFFNNIMNTSAPHILREFSSTTTKPTTPKLKKSEQNTFNIGFQKKTAKFIEEKPLRNVNRFEFVTEPVPTKYTTSTFNTISAPERGRVNKEFTSTTPTTVMTTTPYTITTPLTTSTTMEMMAEDNKPVPSSDYYQAKFSEFVEKKPQKKPETTTPEISRKFQNIIKEETSKKSDTYNLNTLGDEKYIPNKNYNENSKTSLNNKVTSEIASTTSTTKSTTTTEKFEPTTTTEKIELATTATLTTTTTKSTSFPTRVSRVNPAIKLAAKNLGGGRRSYQSSTNCSSDNSLQANPKCNEIKYQRPTSTRGRGSAHYSTSSGSESSQPAPNRGTPPTRSRPTLKPSTAIVSKTTEFVDIYAHPPSRPAPVYPQPTPDKTAAKCRKDVCLLPDCYCGGKDIPGDMPVETVPQIVLLTFDDSVNDLNKVLYADLFEKGRVNPNGCPISATFYVSHEWTDYSQVQNLYSAGHEMASHTISHSFGEQFSQKKWNREVAGQREILAAYGGVKLEDVRGMRAPFLSVGGNKMFKMLYDSNFTYDSSLPVYENKPPSWPYTLDYKLFHDCMIPPCPTKSYPGVWEVPMVMWQDLNGGRCSMGDACANPPEAENVYKMILKNFDRHYTTNRAPFGLFYHAAWFTQPHHKEGFIMFLDFINQMPDVWIVTNWQALQWVRDPTPISRLNNFQPFQCNYQDRPKKCNNPKVCNLWHKSGVRYMRTCQPCPEVYPWTGKSGIRSSRIDNDIGE
ncbi:mucin-17 [Manduca sexta]|uniref:mucin-17 n=1 Tax=Manduca sexta TaxID=7130 RepID=UPI0018901005|nr:mucin-17 [Manduca sexta]